MKKKSVDSSISDNDDITKLLIKDINDRLGHRSAYNLADDMSAPTIVKRWVSTGSRWLDYCISNMGEKGGYPEGRIIEIAGLPSLGKSHLGYMAAASCQRAGGVVVYIDSENATMLDKLDELGVDVEKNFVYVDSHCTEEVLSVIESTVQKAHILQAKKDVPLLVVWDSVAATSPKAELNGEYDQNTIGLQARTLSKGFRKLTPVIGENNVTMICLNQLRMKVNLSSPYEDPYCVDPKTTRIKIKYKRRKSPTT